MAIDQSRPLPLLNNRSLYIIVKLKPQKKTAEDGAGDCMALVQVPAVSGNPNSQLSRIIPINDGPSAKEFIFLEDVLRLYIKELFVDGGRMLKRLRPAPQGRGHRIRKRSNHITLVLGSRAEQLRAKEVVETTETENQ